MDGTLLLSGRSVGGTVVVIVVVGAFDTIVGVGVGVVVTGVEDGCC